MALRKPISDKAEGPKAKEHNTQLMNNYPPALNNAISRSSMRVSCYNFSAPAPAGRSLAGRGLPQTPGLPPSMPGSTPRSRLAPGVLPPPHGPQPPRHRRQLEPRRLGPQSSSSGVGVGVGWEAAGREAAGREAAGHVAQQLGVHHARDRKPLLERRRR